MRPEHLDFMDADMKSLWNQMDPVTLKGYQLHGGTALALYLNHRKSTDFDFFRADGGPVDRGLIQRWRWLQGARFRGERGMVDALIEGDRRNISLNFVSIEEFNGIPPHHPPIRAANGVPVGHPVDVLTGKLAAMSNRREVRDYWDIASAHQAIPGVLREAAELYLADRMTAEETPVELAKTVMAFPHEVEQEMPGTMLEALSGFASALGKHTVPTDKNRRTRADEGDALKP